MEYLCLLRSQLYSLYIEKIELFDLNLPTTVVDFEINKIEMEIKQLEFGEIND